MRVGYLCIQEEQGYERRAEMAIAEQTTQPPVSSEALEEHRGKWVAVRGGGVIASADTAEQLAADERVEPMDALYHVPESPGLFY